MRTPKLTVLLTQRICRQIETGIPPDVAARLHGLSLGTFMEWLQIGNGEHPTRRATPRYKRFAQAVDKAEAVAIEAKVGAINKAIKRGKVGAARWWLERRDSRHFPSSKSPGVSIGVSTTLVKMLQTIVSEPDPPDPRRVLIEQEEQQALSPPALPEPDAFAPLAFEPVTTVVPESLPFVDPNTIEMVRS